MRINKIELENITTHKDSIIEFKDGINVFLGKNGSGKSTVLKMIGFALFDWMPNSQASYVTSNSKLKTGKVSVWFIGSDNKEYKVERSVGISKFEITDVAINKVIKSITKVDDLRAWLKDMFNLDPSYDLDTIFENSVGVEQGTFTAPFLLSPSDRKKIFDPILKVDAYEELYEKLQPVYKNFEKKSLDLEVNISRIDGQLRTKPDDQAKLEIKTKEFTDINNSLSSLISEQKKIIEVFEGLKKKSDEINSLDKELASLREQKKNLEELIKKKNEEIEESKKSQAILNNNKESYEQFKKIKIEQQRIEKEIQELEKINENINVQEKTIVANTQSIFDRQKTVDEIEVRGKELNKLKDINDKSNLLDGTIKDLTNKLGEINEKERALKVDIKNKATLEKEIKSLEKGLESLLNIEKLEEEQQRLQNKETEFISEISELKANLKECEKNKRELKGGLCPFLHEECKNLQGQSLQDHFQESINKLNLDIEKKEIEREKIGNSLKKIQVDIKTTQELLKKQIVLNEKKGSLTELSSKINVATEFLSIKEATSLNLENSKKEYKNYEQDRNRYQVLTSDLLKIEGFKKEIQQLQEICSKSKKEVDSLKIKISPLPGLKENKNKNLELTKKLRSSYDLYVQNLKIADLLESRLKDLDSINNQQKLFLFKFNDIENKYNSLIKTFNVTEFENTQIKKDNLRDEISALKARSNEISKTIKELNDKMQNYIVLEKDLTNLRKNLVKIQEIQSLISKMRTWFRDSRPRITKFLLTKIGIRASEIFQNIMENSALNLEWKEDYQLLVHSPYSDKNFNQLSGGEQMAGALSIRLALLQTLSSIDFAFFDEPTTNLDVEKRRNLANCIQNIKGFKQLFIISHDDTFEGMADHVITFEKNTEDITIVK